MCMANGLVFFCLVTFLVVWSPGSDLGDVLESVVWAVGDAD